MSSQNKIKFSTILALAFLAIFTLRSPCYLGALQNSDHACCSGQVVEQQSNGACCDDVSLAGAEITTLTAPAAVVEWLPLPSTERAPPTLVTWSAQTRGPPKLAPDTAPLCPRAPPSETRQLA